jgi:hypothetical protein
MKTLKTFSSGAPSTSLAASDRNSGWTPPHAPLCVELSVGKIRDRSLWCCSTEELLVRERHHPHDQQHGARQPVLVRLGQAFV